MTGFCFCKIFLLWAFIIESMEGGQEYEILQFFSIHDGMKGVVYGEMLV